MASIVIEDCDPKRHKSPMWYIDHVQQDRHHRAPTIVPSKVCLVTVCSFTFIFRSLTQLRLVLEYYSQEHHPSGRLPFPTAASAVITGKRSGGLRSYRNTCWKSQSERRWFAL
jgi:hypothetical protein